MTMSFRPSPLLSPISEIVCANLSGCAERETVGGKGEASRSAPKKRCSVVATPLETAKSGKESPLTSCRLAIDLPSFVMKRLRVGHSARRFPGAA